VSFMKQAKWDELTAKECDECDGMGMVQGNLAAPPGDAPDLEVCPACKGGGVTEAAHG
jgi:DnaJ-class molecular chaperone